MEINNDMLNNLKSTLGEKQVNDALSQISPEMIEQFSNMMKGNQSESTTNSNFNNNPSNNNNSNTNFDFGNIDMATLMKFKGVFDKLNSNKDDPRSNLLNSLKPYMRDSRKESIDKYAQMLKMADLAAIFNEHNVNNTKKEKDENEYN